MGHFEKGAWVKDPYPNIDEFVESVSHLQDGVQKAAESLIEWNKHSGNFEKGAEITIIRTVERTFETFADSILDGLSQCDVFRDIIQKSNLR